MFHPQIVNQIIGLVATKEKTDQILIYSRKVYDLHQFNVANLYPKDVRKMNDSLKRRYKRQEIENLPTNWNEGQRRLFVWFIVCFLYLKKISISDITQNELLSLSEVFYNKHTIFLDFQLRNLPRAIKANRTWSQEEDDLLINAIKTLKGDLDDPKPFNNWNDVAKMIFFQTQRKTFRTPKSCRQRWYNHLDKSKKKDDFTSEEDLTLINHILTVGKGWSKIVKIMNYSRTEHRIKNRYYTLIRKYQKSQNDDMVEEMNEQRQRQILHKIKEMYESTEKDNRNLEEIYSPKENETSNEIKFQQDLKSKVGKVRKNGVNQSVNKNQGATVKQQNNELQFQQVNTVKPNYSDNSDLKSSSLKIFKNDSQLTFKQSQQQQDFAENQMIWGQNYMQLQMYWNLYEQSLCSSQSILNQALLMNQFYCPIISPNTLDFQFYYNN